MKEATEFGIKYVQTRPDGHQDFVMHEKIWKDRKEAERVVEALRGVVPCPMLVELWEPGYAGVLMDGFDTTPVQTRTEEPFPKPEGKIEMSEPVTVDPKWDTHTLTYIGHPDGTVTVTEDGKEITDPEQQKQIRDRIHKPFDWTEYWRNLGRMFLWDPSQEPWYGTGGYVFTTSTGGKPRFQSECSNPAFKCECGD